MDIHQLPVQSITLIATVLAIGISMFIQTIRMSRKYPAPCGPNIGLQDFRSNAPWWSERTKFQIKECGLIAENDYVNFTKYGVISSLIKAGYNIKITKSKDGTIESVGYEGWADDMY